MTLIPPSCYTVSVGLYHSPNNQKGAKNEYKQNERNNLGSIMLNGDGCRPNSSLFSEDYFEMLEAPAKSFIWFENSAHDIQYDEPDKFSQEIIRIAREVLNP